MTMDRRAPGFTLVEILIVAVVGAIMLGAIFQTLVVQQRSFREENAIIRARQTTRTSLELLATELRAASATGGDLVLATADSLTFRAYRKVGFVCENVVGVRLDIIQLGNAFENGDDIMVFVDGDTLTSDDDAWMAAEVSSTGSAGCTDTWGSYTKASIVSNPVASVINVREGALIQAYELLTYGSYNIDGEWVVGRHAPDEAPEPLVGPIASPTDTGLRFRYFDDTGTEITPSTASLRAQVARIQILVRGLAMGTGSAQQRERLDSLLTEVHFRGNAWY